LLTISYTHPFGNVDLSFATLISLAFANVIHNSFSLVHNSVKALFSYSVPTKVKNTWGFTEGGKLALEHKDLIDFAMFVIYSKLFFISS